MLGSMVDKNFRDSDSVTFYATSRKVGEGDFVFNLRIQELDYIVKTLNPNYIINCVSANPQQKYPKFSRLSHMIVTNSIFPRRLSKYCEKRGIRLIQPCTNGVYSGRNGPYNEKSRKIPTSFYGLTKLMGERDSKLQLNLRCSLVGPEIRALGKSLFQWLLSQPKNSQIYGYTNHLWNGITTNAFAKICLYMIENDSYLTGNLHLVPSDSISKYELLKYIQSSIKRFDIKIEAWTHEKLRDQRLGTIFQDKLAEIWRGIGYLSPPTIKQLIIDLENLQDRYS